LRMRTMPHWLSCSAAQKAMNQLGCLGLPTQSGTTPWGKGWQPCVSFTP